MVATSLDADDVRAIARHAQHHGLRITPQSPGHARFLGVIAGAVAVGDFYGPSSVAADMASATTAAA